MVTVQVRNASHKVLDIKHDEIDWMTSWIETRKNQGKLFCLENKINHISRVGNSGIITMYLIFALDIGIKSMTKIIQGKDSEELRETKSEENSI